MRERIVAVLRSFLGILDDQTAYQKERALLLQTIETQNAALAAQRTRLENLEKLVVEDNRLIRFHHEVLERWATQSATLRDIEDVHAKKLKREAAKVRSISEVKREIEGAVQQLAAEGPSGREEEVAQS